MLVTGVKRVRWPSKAQQEVERAAKRQKQLPFRHSRGWGQLLTVGQGDTGQLGLGEDVMEKSRPAAVTELSAAVDAVAGGMHTVVLDKDGEVWTFGCNDDGSLGRVVEEEEECFLPGKVPLPEKMVMLSAGDSHTAALSQSGQVKVTVSHLTSHILYAGLCLGNIPRQQWPDWSRRGHEGGEGPGEGAGGRPRDQDRVRLGPPGHAQLRRSDLDDGELRAGPAGPSQREVRTPGRPERSGRPSQARTGQAQLQIQAGRLHRRLGGQLQHRGPDPGQQGGGDGPQQLLPDGLTGLQGSLLLHAPTEQEPDGQGMEASVHR